MKTATFAKRAIGVGMMAALGLTLASPALHVAAQDAPVSVAASGLINPRGVAFDPATGELLVASAGVGGASAQIVKIVDGCPVVAVDGLPSAGSVTMPNRPVAPRERTCSRTRTPRCWNTESVVAGTTSGRATSAAASVQATTSCSVCDGTRAKFGSTPMSSG